MALDGVIRNEAPTDGVYNSIEMLSTIVGLSNINKEKSAASVQRPRICFFGFHFVSDARLYRRCSLTIKKLRDPFLP